MKARNKNRALLIVIVLLFMSGSFSCRRYTSVSFGNGVKRTDTRMYGPRRSTTYTAIGKTVYTDSISGKRTKVVKYITRNSCWSSYRFMRIEITYDSTGNRIGRENVLRQQRKKRRQDAKACDSCGGLRRVRARF